MCVLARRGSGYRRWTRAEREMVRRLFTYAIAHDGGFAPNPFHGVLTLNCFKPDIRRTARVEDGVAANTAEFPAGRGLMVYAMRVTDKMTMAEKTIERHLCR